MMTKQEQDKLTGVPFNKGGPYSFDNYASWGAVVRLLAKRGYTAAEAEAILRSKWMRWAADASDSRYGKVPANALAKFLDDPRNQCTIGVVRAMIEVSA